MLFVQASNKTVCHPLHPCQLSKHGFFISLERRGRGVNVHLRSLAEGRRWRRGGKKKIQKYICTRQVHSDSLAFSPPDFTPPRPCAREIEISRLQNENPGSSPARPWYYVEKYIYEKKKSIPRFRHRSPPKKKKKSLSYSVWAPGNCLSAALSLYSSN